MKRTYLELVRSVLNDTDCEDVNDINETTEATQVLSLMEDLFWEFTTRPGFQWRDALVELDPLSDTDRPVYLKTPDGVMDVKWFKYNVKDSANGKDEFRELIYQTPVDFFYRANALDTTASNVETVKALGGGTFAVTNDKAPQYWTTVDDHYIVCDSYDSSLESTLVGVKTQAFVQLAKPFVPDNDTFPPLPEEFFPSFLAELKMLASPILRRQRDTMAEWQAQRQRQRLSHEGWRMRGGDQYPNYGRKSRSGKQADRKIRTF